MPILGPGSFLELGQKDPRVLGLGVCPELTEEEMSELRGVLEKEGLKVKFRDPDLRFMTHTFFITEITSERHCLKVKELVRRTLDKKR